MSEVKQTAKEWARGPYSDEQFAAESQLAADRRAANIAALKQIYRGVQDAQQAAKEARDRSYAVEQAWLNGRIEPRYDPSMLMDALALVDENGKTLLRGIPNSQ